MQGKIHRLIRGKGFGFIQAEGQQYFFHHTEVRGMEFRRLGVGDVVEFQAAPEVEPGKNPRAVELTLVAKAEPPPLDALAAPPEPVRSGERGVRRPAAGRPASPRRAPSRDASGAGIVEEELEAAEFGDELVLEHQPAVLSPPGPVSSPLGPPEGTVGALPERAARPEGAVGARAGEGGVRGAVEPEAPAEDAAYFPEVAAEEETEPGALAAEPAAVSRRPSTRGKPRGDSRGDRRDRGDSRGRGRGAKGARGAPGPRRQRSSKPRVERPKATGAPGERGEGVIRSINAKRGFGFIETVGGDLFFHRSGVKDDFDALNVGSRVVFVFGEGDRGAQAQDVYPV